METIIKDVSQEGICNCQFCSTIIAKLTTDGMIPSAEECYQRGNVPIPNFGWFCSQECASKYEKQYGTKFTRTENGLIDYYTKSI